MAQMSMTMAYQELKNTRQRNRHKTENFLILTLSEWRCRKRNGHLSEKTHKNDSYGQMAD